MSMTQDFTTAYDLTVGARRKPQPVSTGPLATYIRNLRLELGTIRYTAERADEYTQSQFADDLKISQVHVARLERYGKLPKPALLKKIRVFVGKAGLDPMGFVYAWLEQQGLHEFIEDIKRERKGSAP